MDDKLNSIFNEARRVALTADEKAMGREMLQSYMALTPMRAAAATKPAKKAVPWRVALFGRAAGVAGLVTTMLASAAGVSFAAEGSLPGDVLYPVKVAVNEEVRVALAPTEGEKAKVEAERAERRLAEAEALAKKGALKAETRVALETKFKAHAEKAKKRLEKAAPADAGAAIEVAAHIEGTLAAHGKIVAALEAENDEEDAADEDEERKTRRQEKKREVIALAETIKLAAREAAEERGKAEERKVRAEAEAIAKAEARAEERANGRRTNAERRRVAAEKKINETRAYLVKMRAKLGEEATKEAEQRLIVAEGVVGEGNAKLAAGDFDAAFEAYVRAQRIANEAKPLIRARGDLKVKVRLDVDDDESRDRRWNREPEKSAPEPEKKAEPEPKEEPTQKDGDRRDGNDDERNDDERRGSFDFRLRDGVKLNVDGGVRARLGR